MLFEPDPDDAARPHAHSKRYERALGLLYILGTVVAVVVILYLLGLLD